MFQTQSPINHQFKAKRKGILLMMPKKPINKNQGEWIEVRFMVLISGFQHLVGDHLFGGKINCGRRKMQIHTPLNIVKMH